MPFILALDLATTTGFSAGAGETAPELGSVVIPAPRDDNGTYADFFDRWLNGKVDHFLEAAGVDIVRGDYGPRAKCSEDFYLVFECPVLPKARFNRQTQRMEAAATNIDTTRKLQGLAILAEMVATRRNLECREVHLQTAKKELSGSGRAEKPDMMVAARRCGLAPRSFDEADAFAVWLVGVRHYAPTFQQIWDQKLWQSRGAMI